MTSDFFWGDTLYIHYAYTFMYVCACVLRLRLHSCRALHIHICHILRRAVYTRSRFKLIYFVYLSHDYSSLSPPPHPPPPNTLLFLCSLYTPLSLMYVNTL